MSASETKRLLVVGSGHEAFRAYAMRSMATRASLALLTGAQATWELEYVDAHEVVAMDDEDAVLAAARRLKPDGVMTYDERYVELAAVIAADLGLPYASPAAIRACKDKLGLRRLLAEHELSPVRFGVAHDLAEAHAVAARVGYPLVLKPRALAGSAGVVRVDDPEALAAAFDDADDAHIGPIRSAYAGVLVEELLEGPEYSVDCVTLGGRTTPVVVAEKVLGPAPYFEEIGHFVPAARAPGLCEALELVRRVHEVVGLESLATHTEFKLTPAGPRIIEVNVRMGGDLIPYLGLLATGVDLPAAAADVALGVRPDVAPRHEGAAAVRFFYPDEDLEIEHVGLDVPETELAGLDRFLALVSPGDTLLLPPRGFISRLALAVVTGADREQCEARLDAVGVSFICEGSPLTLAAAVGAAE